MASARAAETVQELEGQVSMDSLGQFFVAFDVPAGTRAIEIAHDDCRTTTSSTGASSTRRVCSAAGAAATR
ncbi:hypothetical protein OV079_14990 [Nannocystis pusilla]|uniref:Uncharacterized protein n=1 Tax=Nannocystis pusilla TaxID=889268 RepID=A0A9X3IXC2_9BACT|nr:hypothetical protein [Nannocystis pusilla]MCY1006835.1 hypothetical protein [Nannocystis pusilla]